MASEVGIRARCVTLLAALNAELGWGLEAIIQQRYCAELAQLLPISCSDGCGRSGGDPAGHSERHPYRIGAVGPGAAAQHMLLPIGWAG
jgi:hypothetical protein